MSTRKWRGSAAKTFQVDTYTVGGTITTEDFTITINGKDVTFTGVSGTAADTASALQVLLAASTEPEFLEVTWTVNSAVITGTANVAGKPFTATVNTPGGSATFVKATPTAATGPNDWANADNWSGGAVPVNSDDVVIENSDVSILYGLSQAAVNLTTLTIRQSFTGTLGLPERNEDGTESYAEYRDQFLTIGSTNIYIGQGAGAGSGRIKLDTDTNDVAIDVYNTGSPLDDGLEAFLFKNGTSTTSLNVNKGSVGVAVGAGEAADVDTLRIGYTNSRDDDSSVRCGSGAALATISQSGGTLGIASNVTTLTMTGGELTIDGTATVTTLTIDGGTCYYRSSGTATTVNIGGGGTVDCSQDMRGRTFTNVNLQEGGGFIDSFKTVTLTNGVDLERCAIADVTLDLGTHVTLTPSAP